VIAKIFNIIALSLTMVVFNQTAIASSIRTIPGDAVISSSGTKTWTFPSTAGTLLNQGSVTAGTNLKITYATTGLVTSGTTAATTDLSDVSTSSLAAGQIFSYNGSAWHNVTPIQEIPSGSVNGSNSSFSASTTPISSATYLLYLNGKMLQQGSGKDYTISGSSITVPTPPAIGQTLWSFYWH
jgi:hypothetical protein